MLSIFCRRRCDICRLTRGEMKSFWTLLGRHNFQQSMHNCFFETILMTSHSDLRTHLPIHHLGDAFVCRPCSLNTIKYFPRRDFLLVYSDVHKSQYNHLIIYPGCELVFHCRPEICHYEVQQVSPACRLPDVLLKIVAACPVAKCSCLCLCLRKT